MFRFLVLNFFLQATTAIVSPYTQIIFRNKGYSNTLVGVIIAVGQVASVVMPIMFCILSDKTRKTKLITIILTVAAAVLFIPTVLSGSVVVTAIAFFFAFGAFWTYNPMMDGYQTRLLSGDASKYGVARSFGTFGYILCLLTFALTGIPDETDNRSILMVMTIILGLFLLSLLIIPKDIPRGKEEGKGKSFSFKWFSKKYYLMMLVIAIGRMGETVINRMLSGYMTEVLNLGSKFTLMIALGACSEMVMMIVGGRLLQKGKVTAFSMIIMGSVGMTLRLLIYYLFPNVVAFACAQLLHSLTFGFLHIGATKFIALNVKEEHYSLAMSLYWAIATNLPQMFGALIAGVIVDHLGYPALFLIFSVFPAISVVLGLSKRNILAD